MATFDEGSHPRSRRGRFVEADKADPGNQMIGDTGAVSNDPVLARNGIDPADIPTSRNQVWEYADQMVNELGDWMETEGREELWAAIVGHANPDWVVGMTQRYRMLREHPEG